MPGKDPIPQGSHNNEKIGNRAEHRDENAPEVHKKLGSDAIKAGELSAGHEPLDLAAAAVQGRELVDAYVEHGDRIDIMRRSQDIHDRMWTREFARHKEVDEIIEQIKPLRYEIFAETGVTPRIFDPGMNAYESSMLLAATVAEEAAEAEFSLDKDDEDFLQQSKVLVDGLNAYKEEHPKEDDEKLKVPYMQRFSVYTMKQTAKRLLVQSAARELLKRRSGEEKVFLTSDKIKKLSEETRIDFSSVEDLRDIGRVTHLDFGGYGPGSRHITETSVNLHPSNHTPLVRRK